MEIVQNRYNVDRVLEKIDSTRIRVMGESLITRGSHNENGNITMYDFEGGPCLNVGGKVKYKGIDFKIISIKPEESKMENVASVILEVTL
jgi:hypothetical protein